MPFPPWGLCVSWNSGLPLVNVWGFWRVFGRSFVLLIHEKTQWYDGESRGNPNVFGLVGSCNRGRVRPSTYLFGKIFSDPNFYCSCPGIWVSDSGSQLLRPTEISRSWKIECVWMRKWAFSDSRMPFPVRYYVIAMLFVIFDIEVIFLYPWAITFHDLGVIGLIEMMIFIGLFVVAYVYAWRKGALEWD